MKKLNVILILLILGCCPFIWNKIVKADEPCINISTVSGLQNGLDNPSCQVIKLSSSFSDSTYKQTFNVTRAVTIEGNASGTSFAGQFNISGTDKDTKITIKNIKLSYRVNSDDDGSSNVLVTSPVQLNIENFSTNYGFSTLNELKNFRTINFLEGVDESTLNIKNSTIYGPYEGIRIGGSNVKVNIENSTIYGRYGLALGVDKSLNTHENNIINISGSTIVGQSTAELEAPLLIAGQKNLTVNIGKSKSGRETTLTNDYYKDTSLKAKGADIIRFYNGSDGSLKNENVKIYINDQTELNDNSKAESSSHLFHFGASSLDNNNFIYLGSEVKLISGGSSNIPINRKYNEDSYVVVGLYDFDGSAVVAHYDPSTVNEDVSKAQKKIENKLDSNKYRTSWHTATPFSDENKQPSSLNANTDLYPKKVELYDVTINGNSYKAEENQKLIDVASTDIEQMQNNSVNNKIFVSFYEDGGEDISDINNYTVTKDVTIKARYNVEITVENEDSFKVTIPENGNLKDHIYEFEAIEKADGKTFKHFEANGKEVDLENTTFNTNTILKRKYTVNVTIEGQEYTYVIDEGETLENLESKYNVLEYLKTPQYEGKKTFKEWIITDSEESLSEDTPITKHINIKPIYNLLITIGDKTVTIEEGTTWRELKSIESSLLSEMQNNDRFVKFVMDNNEELNDDYQFTTPKTITAKYYINIIIGDYTLRLLEGENFNNLNNEDKEKVNTIINPSNKEFYRFEKDKTEIKVYETSFNEDTTLIPVYHVTLTINNQKFILRDDQSINTFNDSSLNDLLKDLDDKKFSRLIDESGNEITKDTIITENKTLTIIYSVDIHFGSKIVSVDENTKWSDVLNKINSDNDNKTALENLKEKNGKEWAYFIDSENRILEDDLTFNKHTTITSKFYVKITIKDKILKLIEGEKLSDLDETNQAILNEFLNPSNKTFKYFEENGKEIDYNEKIFDDDTTLNPVYEITITINDQEFKLLDYQPLSSLNLNEFKNVDGKDFAYFTKDDVEVENDAIFTENTILKPVYKIKITIDGQVISNIADNLTFKELIELSEIKEKINSLMNDHFAYFTVNDNQISDSDIISTHSTIKLVYYVYLNVNDVTVKLIQNQKFSELSEEEKNKLLPFESLDTKAFKYYTYNNNIVTENTSFNTDANLIPAYDVYITINDKVFTIKENGKLSDLDENDLNKLKEANDKVFAHFVKDDGTIIDEENTTFDVHTKLNISYNVQIKVKNNTILVEENTTWGEFKNIYSEELSSLNEEAKEIALYVDSEGNILNDDTKLSKNTTISPKFYINIKVGDETLKLIEGQTLNDLSDIDQEKLNNFKNITNKTFKYFTLDKEIINEQTIFNQDCTLIPNYTITIKIGNETFIIDENKGLKDLSKEDLKRYNAIKNLREKQFKYFKNGDYIVDEENDTFAYNTSLVPIYEVNIKIGEKNINVLEGTSFKELKDNNEIYNLILNLQNNENQIFAKFVDDNGNDINDETIFNKNTSIIPKFNIIIKIADKEFNLLDNQTLNDLKTDELDYVKTFMNTTEKQFKYFVDENGNEINLETVIKNNITIIPKYEITIKINEETFTLDEGLTLNDLSSSDKNRLEALKNISGKHFLYFTINNEEINENMKFIVNTSLVPVYNITITVGDYKIDVLEGTSYKELLNN